MKIGLVTCLELPEPDEDEELLLHAVRDAGVEASLVSWDDPELGFEGFDAMILRSTWNYHLQLDRFQRWVEEASRNTVLLNPPDVVRENAHKGYLLDLEAQGIRVVPTALFPRGRGGSLRALCDERGWSEVVIKPAVSGGSFETHRFGTERLEEAQTTFERLVADRDVIVQPYLPAFENPGEHSVVWIDGVFTHTIHKHPRFADQDESVEIVENDPAELAMAERLIAPYADRILYGRVDLIESAEGPLLCELELIEPSLFLARHPPALERLVQGTLRRVEQLTKGA